jgi:hypothetical protein
MQERDDRAHTHSGGGPTGRFDMILLSEVLCYLSVDDLMQTSRRAR